ncbi:hypothetical protein SAMN02745166_01841 [Prosthecobacter debontii]|uniref:Uncharacterized protein n=1 Tax=Prosthecobacter debontii TaxID=48467 RepID=A0A1T4XRV4_9BACT|nr:hypothetical protein [Prosthecobacter debontii]SKA92103.1 hypothetical protein SAMN02745166_01841 [Prosthecobacter debontii]
MKRLLFIMTLLAGFCQSRVHAQAEAGDENERVQYVLIMPDEKTPELVKPEENNPFEAASDGRVNDESDTEENQVRDMLLGMRVGGAASGPRGMRVMLGGMRLEPGMEVPQIIPDQQVKLRVKNITTSAIELVWVEKRATGLPPKLLVIPMDGGPSVRYRMPAGGPSGAGGSMGTIRRPEVSAFTPAPVDTKPQVAKAEPVQQPQEAPAEAKPAPKPSTPPAPANVPEASVLRMLFGNHAPAAK